MRDASSSAASGPLPAYHNRKQLHGVTARFEAALHGSAGPALPSQGNGGGAEAAGQASGGATPVTAMYESFTLGWLNLLMQHLWCVREPVAFSASCEGVVPVQSCGLDLRFSACTGDLG
jgi:hypothetical protein